jgi:hypothetical protein
MGLVSIPPCLHAVVRGVTLLKMALSCLATTTLSRRIPGSGVPVTRGIVQELRAHGYHLEYTNQSIIHDRCGEGFPHLTARFMRLSSFTVW